MFNFEDKKLEGLGAIITTKEIKQQPELWAEAYEIYKANKTQINEFIENIGKKHGTV